MIMNVISAPIKRHPRELPRPLDHVRTQKTAICGPGGEPSPDTKSHSALILDFTYFKKARYKLLVFIGHPVQRYFVIAALRD